ncbi:hypothetical protein [Rhodopila sp.]|uniref:hypothetical protein n=1 Tax=Rhodopila sp. TaxID=2480087 RepID=UPI003D1484E2
MVEYPVPSGAMMAATAEAFARVQRAANEAPVGGSIVGMVARQVVLWSMRLMSAAVVVMVHGL